MLRNAVGVSAFPEKRVTKVYGSTFISVTRGGGGWGHIPRKKALRNTWMNDTPYLINMHNMLPQNAQQISL